MAGTSYSTFRPQEPGRKKNINNLQKNFFVQDILRGGDRIAELNQKYAIKTVLLPDTCITTFFFFFLRKKERQNGRCRRTGTGSLL
jgi:hypothetical protein